MTVYVEWAELSENSIINEFVCRERKKDYREDIWWLVANHDVLNYKKATTGFDHSKLSP